MKLSHILLYVSRKHNMNFSFSGHHIDITEAMREYAEKKVAILNNRSDQIVSIKLTLTQDQTSNNKFKLDGVVAIKDNSIVATALGNQGSEVYSMIDSLVGKLERQIRKQKGKVMARKKGNTSIKHLEIADESLV